MNDRDLEHRLLIACAVAREAGRLAHDYFIKRDQLDVEHKGVQDLVSIADREVEELIRTRLGVAFPDDAMLGEEGGGEGLPGAEAADDLLGDEDEEQKSAAGPVDHRPDRRHRELPARHALLVGGAGLPGRRQDHDRCDLRPGPRRPVLGAPGGRRLPQRAPDAGLGLRRPEACDHRLDLHVQDADRGLFRRSSTRSCAPAPTTAGWARRR